MAEATTATLDSSKHINWMWQSNPNPPSKSEKLDWNYFSDVQNLIIEEAFLNKQSRAMLDGYYIDFKHNVQISNDNENKQRPVKRMEHTRDNKNLREERFMNDPIAPKRPIDDHYGWISPFIIEVRRYLKLRKDQLPSKDEALIPMLIERAADGIIEEGKRIRKHHEAEKLATMLREKKDKGMKDVWQCCAYIYSLESFLYTNMNEVMQLIGSEEHKQIWRSKVRTLGPFCLLLWDDPFHTKMKTKMILYRGANLTDGQVATYEEMAKKEKEYRSCQAFISCSRNRRKADEFGNTLFIMQVLFTFTADISNVSEYPGEEEELIMPGVCFRVQSVKFDEKTKKRLITLQLKQRFNEEIKTTDNQNVQLNDYDNNRRVDPIDDYDYRYACLAASYLTAFRDCVVDPLIDAVVASGARSDDCDAFRRVIRDQHVNSYVLVNVIRMADTAADYVTDYDLDRYDRDGNCVV